MSSIIFKILQNILGDWADGIFGRGDRIRLHFRPGMDENRGIAGPLPGDQQSTGLLHLIRSSPVLSYRNNKREAAPPFYYFGADDRTRTCTLARWNLNPMSLPIPPHPHILLYL